LGQPSWPHGPKSLSRIVTRCESAIPNPPKRTFSTTTSRDPSVTHTARLLSGTNALSEHEIPPFEQSISKLSRPLTVTHLAPEIDNRFVSARSPVATANVHIAVRPFQPLMLC
jgi:hypothetical protein